MKVCPNEASHASHTGQCCVSLLHQAVPRSGQHCRYVDQPPAEKMHLIDTQSLDIHEFVGDQTPSYVILSHTWGHEEVSYQDMAGHNGQAKVELQSRAGYQKIAQFCQKARQDGFAYAWVDTCCIDKKSSAELSESINSMYEWYKQARICYVYLADTVGSLFAESGEPSYWFSRGWTLQELIAPLHVEFYDREWALIGTKIAMSEVLSDITRISRIALSGGQPAGYSVAERFSWAAGRRTTRPEDRAYSLLGLFGIHMPLLYGEGENAFQRLQKKIMKSSDDRSILAWSASYLERDDGSMVAMGLLARSPDDFEQSHHIYSDTNTDIIYQWPPIFAEWDVILNLPTAQRPYSDKSTMTWIDIGCRRFPHENFSVFVRLLGGRFRVGRPVIIEDGFRKENKFVPQPVRAKKDPISSPRLTPLAFYFADAVDTSKLSSGNATENGVQAKLRFFETSLDHYGDKHPSDPDRRLIYSEDKTYSASSRALAPSSRSVAICQGEEVLLRPDLDSSWDDSSYDQDKPVLYTVCLVTLELCHVVLCKITLGALHYPDNRPWCTIGRPGDPGISPTAEVGDDDSNWFRAREQRGEWRFYVPEQCETICTTTEGVDIRINVTLKRRNHENNRLCYSVNISAATVIDGGEEPKGAIDDGLAQTNALHSDGDAETAEGSRAPLRRRGKKVAASSNDRTEQPQATRKKRKRR